MDLSFISLRAEHETRARCQSCQCALSQGMVGKLALFLGDERTTGSAQLCSMSIVAVTSGTGRRPRSQWQLMAGPVPSKHPQHSILWALWGSQLRCCISRVSAATPGQEGRLDLNPTFYVFAANVRTRSLQQRPCLETQRRKGGLALRLGHPF